MRLIVCVLFTIMTGSCATTPEYPDRFVPCADSTGLAELNGTLCLTVSAPVAHDGQEGERIGLFVRKFPARGPSRGQLWLIAGGPGESGATFHGLMDSVRLSFPNYDIIVPDHRGTGYSGKLCPVEEAPDSVGGIALEGGEWRSCIANLRLNVARTQAFTITNAARDLAMLIGELRGRERTYVYGVSYGTQLVLRMMQVAPPRLDGIIFDSIIPPEGDARWDLSHRTQTTDAVGRRVLNAEEIAAYKRVLAIATTKPEWLARIPGGDLKSFMGALLDFPELRARIPALIAGLERGDTGELDRMLEGVRRISEGLGRYPQSAPSLTLVSLVSASENNARPDLTEAMVAAENGDALFTSPLPGYLVEAFPPLYARDQYYGALPHEIPCTLIVQGGLDPKTPVEGARLQAAALQRFGRVQLVEVHDAPHFVLLTAPEQFRDAANDFLNSGRCPALPRGD